MTTRTGSTYQEEKLDLNENSISEETMVCSEISNKPNQDKLIKELIQKEVEENDYIFKGIINSGGFGIVAKVEQYKKKIAIKIIIKEENRELIRGFKGKNIIKRYQEKLNLLDRKYNEKYHCYVMERSFIGSLDKIHDFIDSNLIFKESFVEKLGDNLIRFFAIQIFKAIETLYLGNFVHFDIKPANILIFKGLEIKLIDFSLLKKLENEEGPKEKEKGEKKIPKEKIPIGTPGYSTPEFFMHFQEKLEYDILKKQDYFAIGLVLYMLKYECKSSPIKGCNEINNRQKKNFNLNVTIDSIQRMLYHIKSRKFQDNDFTEFLCNLLQYKPEYRLNFEQIIRNKWLNKNIKEIKKIKNINISDEDNIKLELQKSDFLNNNRKYYRKNFDEKFNNDIKNYRYVRKGKFKFCKRN